MIADELHRLRTWEERHRRLFGRIAVALIATLAVDVLGTVLVWRFERGLAGGDIHGLGDAAFFTTVQLLTVSSQIRNPLTTAGRIVDVALEVWSIVVVTAVAGSFAAFFAAGDT